jgi:hypothetical protein
MYSWIINLHLLCSKSYWLKITLVFTVGTILYLLLNQKTLNWAHMVY